MMPVRFYFVTSIYIFCFDLANHISVYLHEHSLEQPSSTLKKELRALPFGLLLEENKVTQARRLLLMLSEMSICFHFPSIEVEFIIMELFSFHFQPSCLNLNEPFACSNCFSFHANAAVSTPREV